MRHLISAVRNSNFYEVNLVHPNCKNAWSLPIYLEGYSDEIDCIDQNGNIKVSDKPGLGVSYDWNYIKKHTLQKLIID